MIILFSLLPKCHPPSRNATRVPTICFSLPAVVPMPCCTYTPPPNASSFPAPPNRPPPSLPFHFILLSPVTPLPPPLLYPFNTFLISPLLSLPYFPSPPWPIHTTTLSLQQRLTHTYPTTLPTTTPLLPIPLPATAPISRTSTPRPFPSWPSPTPSNRPLPLLSTIPLSSNLTPLV